MKAGVVTLCVFLSVVLISSCELFFADVTGYFEHNFVNNHASIGDKPAVIDAVVSEIQLIEAIDGTYHIAGVEPGFSGVLTIPSEINGITISAIVEGAFINNTDITAVFIPDTIASIGEKAFHGCENITSISIGSTVQSIGSEAFAGCDDLEEIIFPSSVKLIGKDVFGQDSRNDLSVYIEGLGTAVASWDADWNSAGATVYNALDWHKISFNTGNATPIASIPFVSGITILPSNFPETSLSGYVLEGWYTNLTDSSSKVTAFPTSVSTDIIYYAKWILP